MTPDAETTRIDATVIGRVQGVGFRYFVLREAMALGLDGWVANGSDGSVRCVAEGPPDLLERLLARLEEGPAAASVDRVSAAWMPATGMLGRFAIRSGGHPGD